VILAQFVIVAMIASSVIFIPVGTGRPLDIQSLFGTV